MHPALIALLFAAAGGGVPAHQQALDLVRSLYRTEAPPPDASAYFSRDLARAYRKDTGHPGEVGAIDFDWRYGAQDTEIGNLEFFNMEGPRTATIRARFRNFGKPGEVVYDLCHAQRGWRISDVHMAAGADSWDLRKMLKLPAKVDC